MNDVDMRGALGAVIGAGVFLFGAVQAPSVWLDDRGEAFRKELNSPGLAIVVARRGEVVYARGFGTVDLEGRQPVTPDTRFRVASITKPVTAAAVLQQVALRTMDLDAAARLYCPEYPSQPIDPTIRHLLAHQSGIRHPTDAEDTKITGEFARLADAVRLFATKPLAFAPGSSTLYSSFGYTLLGCALEGATTRPYWDVIVQQVLTPAGVRTPARDTPTFAASDFSPGYRGNATGPLRPSIVVDTRFKTPASGLIISAADLARFAIAIAGDAILDAHTRTEMFRVATPNAKPGSFTLGWQVTSPRDGAAAYYHTGSMEGVTAIVYLVPSRRDAIVLLANRERSVPALAPLLTEIGDRLLR
jgi:CubicO group peptidase (beta-lactamase class C family)